MADLGHVSNTINVGGQKTDTATATGAALTASRKRLSPDAAELLAEQSAHHLVDAICGTIPATELLPVWIRAPKSGNEHYTGFTRSFLYLLTQEGKIRSASIQQPGKTKVCRLFELRSILSYIARCEQDALATEQSATAALAAAVGGAA